MLGRDRNWRRWWLGATWIGARSLQSFQALVASERDRWSLWLAPCLAGGIGGYFSLPVEPPVWVGAGTVFLLAALAAVLGSRGTAWAVPVAVVAVLCAGFAVAQAQALRVAAPVLARPLGPVDVAGRVVDLEPHDGRWRMTLAEPVVEGVAAVDTPHVLRVTLQDVGEAVIGAGVVVPARLLPPPSPAAPGGFDFARQAWFEGLGAVGFAVGRPTVRAAPPPSPWRALGDWLTDRRLRVADRLRTGIGGTSGAIAAALATGQRGAIPEDAIEAYRGSGLAHLLAISGLHLGLAAGLVFVVLRTILALIPPVALHHDIKKATAACAILTMAVYLILSGGNVPAQRAFVMGTVAFGAILVDRTAISLRVLAVAAAVVLLWQPYALVGASFQMSFAAVVALVAAYEALAPRLATWRGGARGPSGAAVRTGIVYLFGILASTVIAGLATAPFAAFHFHRIALFGVAANMAAMPLMALWVMPWLAAALLLMPFGWDGVAHVPLGLGLTAVEAIARTVAGWPDAVLSVPPTPVAALVAVALGGLWLCLTRRQWRWVGLPVAMAGLVAPWRMPEPVMVISGDGGVAAVHNGPGLILSPGRGDRFTREIWLERWGEGEGSWAETGLVDSLASGQGGSAHLSCDALGCLYTPGQGYPSIALIHHEAALVEDCPLADVVVATIGIPRGHCPAPLIIDRWDLWRGGAHALYLDDDDRGVRVETVAQYRGWRPWSKDAGRR